jgi:glutathione S-transferase
MITIWGRKTSANVQKVLWLCDEIGVKFERQDVGGPFGGLDRPEFLALNPNQVIPVIRDHDVTRDQDVVVWESHAVMRYLATKYGPESIYPTETQVRSHVERWLDWHLGTLSPVITPVFISLYRTPEAERNADALARQVSVLTKTLVSLDSQMSGRPYFAGEELTIADIAFGNSIWRWLAFPIAHPELPNLQAWQARVASRPAYQTHVAQPVS